jgi:hypothetical protein
LKNHPRRRFCSNQDCFSAMERYLDSPHFLSWTKFEKSSFTMRK